MQETNIMKSQISLVLVCVFVTGCTCLSENLSEHGESNKFWINLKSEPRVSSILDKKPNKNISVRADNRHIIVIVNSPLIVERSFKIDKPNRFIPGNQYSPDELAVIEDVALDIKEKLGIKRKIIIFDETKEHEHEAKKIQTDKP